MEAERDLRTLLGGMRPELNPGRYVFTTVPGDAVPAGVRPVVTVAEPEGLTLVLPESEAVSAGLGHDFTAAWITLRVHSALDAVGLTAAVALALTDAGVSCNVVAGFHHDHLFVPCDRGEEALGVLEALAAESAREPGRGSR
ncbi:ACT domain-containing protein [Streptomyces sp. NPDC057697]|uniref:ACT domain-containing protein n=1 Tax=Streptomyces sp. NPDC057697 TaxID=3346219 RepID=UPI003698D451